MNRHARKIISSDRHGASSDGTDITEIFGSTFAHCLQLQQSAFPETYESWSKKLSSSMPYNRKSASYHPHFTLCGVILQVARSFEHFVKRGKARLGEVHMPGSMPLTNASN